MKNTLSRKILVTVRLQRMQIHVFMYSLRISQDYESPVMKRCKSLELEKTLQLQKQFF